MSEESPEITSSPEDGEAPEASSGEISNLKLVFGIVIMLIPAGIPLYFALGAEGTDIIWLVALAGGIAIINTILVFAIRNWIQSINSDH